MGNTATTKKGDSTESGKFFYFLSPYGGMKLPRSGHRTIRQVANGQHCPKYLHAKFR